MIVTVLGARPQFVKAAVLSKAFKDAGIEEKIIHTGQHYDPNMSDVFFNELNIPGVDANLHIGSGNHGDQTGKMLIAIEEYVLSQEKRISALLVYGDTNSTLAGALVASKLHIPVIHVEAGLRSFNKKMPEEVNRILTDHMSDVLFCSSEEGEIQLRKEGITKNVHVVGDIMQDAVNLFSVLAKKPKMDAQAFNFNQDYNLITIHRPANTDDKIILQDLLDGIGNLSNSCVWPVHPRNKKTLALLNIPDNLTICDPFSYFEMLYALSNCKKVITDSGGLQKEAYWLKKPCITVRPQTEWIETLHNNWNQLAAPNTEDIVSKYNSEPSLNTWKSLYGDGNTAKQIVQILKKRL